jgi:hypothetical protein
VVGEQGFRPLCDLPYERTFVESVAPRKPFEREEARKLRRQGTPTKRIAKALEVSPSSVSYWTRDIHPTTEQQAHNVRGPKGPQDPEVVQRRAAAWRRPNRVKRQGYQEEGRPRARQRDAIHIAGCLLYWAEGAKKRNNSALRQFGHRHGPVLRALPTRVAGRPFGAHHAPPQRIHQPDNGFSIREIEDHWLHALDLPRAALRGHTLNHAPTSSSGRKRDHLPYGVCCVSVLESTRLVQHIYGAIQEYEGFEEPRWLDGPPVKSRPNRRSARTNAERGGRSRPPRPSATRSGARAAPSGRGGGSRPGRRPRSARRTEHPP